MSDFISSNTAFRPVRCLEEKVETLDGYQKLAEETTTTTDQY